MSDLAQGQLFFERLVKPGDIVAVTLFLLFLRVAKLAGNKQNLVLLRWLNEETLFRKAKGRSCALLPTFEEVWGLHLFPHNFDLVIAYFVPIHVVFMSLIPQKSWKAMSNSLSSSFQFLSFFHPFCFDFAVSHCCSLAVLGNVFNE